MEQNAAWYNQVNQEIEQELARHDPQCTWLPSLVERGNPLTLSREYFEPRLPDCRSIILHDGGPLEWPDCQAPGKSWFHRDIASHLRLAQQDLAQLKQVLIETLAGHGAQWIDFQDDGVGNPYLYEVNGRPETNANLRNTFYFSLLKHYVSMEQHASFMDLGGGYGEFAARIAAANPAASITFLDLPRMVCVASYLMPRRPMLQGRTGNLLFLMPWHLPSFRGPVDVVVNTMSFQHMNEANLRFYFSRFRDLGVKQVFSVNREQGVREGEAPAYGEVLKRYGYTLEVRKDLRPWRGAHFLNVWSVVHA